MLNRIEKYINGNKNGHLQKICDLFWISLKKFKGDCEISPLLNCFLFLFMRKYMWNFNEIFVTIFICRNTERKNRAPQWLSQTQIPLLARVFFQVERLQGERTKRSLPLSVLQSKEGENHPRSLALILTSLPRLRRSINLVTLRRFLSCRGSSWPYFIISSQFNSFVCALQAENNLFIWTQRCAVSLVDWLYTAGDSICAVAGEGKFIQVTTNLSAWICLQFAKGMLHSVTSRLPQLHPRCHYGKFILLAFVWNKWVLLSLYLVACRFRIFRVGEFLSSRGFR